MSMEKVRNNQGIHATHTFQMLEPHSKVEAPPLQQRNFADENFKRTPKTLSEAQEALFFICQKPLKEDKDMTKKIFQKLENYQRFKGTDKSKWKIITSRSARGS